ncbi:hypothetical protein T03_9016 [Trichinella britovi]|uniref:Uncharacterized protein n=1 Tax=Trichinella britovi TaxID=45882 RepID=A0A0V1D0I8_TRIBR|nr:hypothetical protein T09_7804 [Trichinella sp. T9]KRY54925.1 hypothetical protein T03_9016 [Trichinella britovi]KRZ88166.1 hypothetical protein T08_857 [Trichinella sp. T8]
MKKIKAHNFCIKIHDQLDEKKTFTIVDNKMDNSSFEQHDYKSLTIVFYQILATFLNYTALADQHKIKQTQVHLKKVIEEKLSNIHRSVKHNTISTYERIVRSMCKV